MHTTDHAWVRVLMIETWGAEFVLIGNKIFYPHTLPGLVAWQGDERLGLVTYHIEGNECEVVTLNALQHGKGIGRQLLQSVEEVARLKGCRRLWLITTNDNTTALAFYQKVGYRMVAIHRDAVTAARKRKPQIPLIGDHGIPIMDEIELEKILQ